MTIEEMEERHARQISTPDGVERYAESRYRAGYVAGYIQAINRMWELMFDEHLSREDAYAALWGFAQTGKLSQWQQERRDTPGYLSEPDNWPPKLPRQTK